LRFEFPAARLSAGDRERIIRDVSRLVPLGDAPHRGKGVPVPDGLSSTRLSTSALEHERERLAGRHLGTLGGGNHFLELDRDGGAGGDLWLLVHSGSRGLGAAIGMHPQRAAAAKGQGTIPGLKLDTAEGAACLADLDWALAFARANRDRLVSEAARVVADRIG